MSKRVQKVWNAVTTVLVILVVVLALLLVGVRLVGLRPMCVLSGSMEPTYHTGSLIYVKPCAPEDVQVGDPITFVVNEDLDVVTHRVVSIDAENQHFYTKGDANDAPDGAPVYFKNLIGRPVFTIPYLGYVSHWVSNPPGMYLAIALALVLVVALAVGATWAYLAQTTKTVQNTFAVGSILDNDGEFTLKEHELANPDATDGAYKVKTGETGYADAGVTYRAIVPGVNVEKDPTVKVTGVKTAVYLYVVVDNKLDSALKANIASDWTLVKSEGTKSLYVYKNTPVAAGTASVVAPILTNNQVVVGTNFPADETAAANTIDFTAYMVQSATFNTASEAWAASPYASVVNVNA